MTWILGCRPAVLHAQKQNVLGPAGKALCPVDTPLGVNGDGVWMSPLTQAPRGQAPGPGNDIGLTSPLQRRSMRTGSPVLHLAAIVVPRGGTRCQPGAHTLPPAPRPGPPALLGSLGLHRPGLGLGDRLASISQMYLSEATYLL